MKKTHEKYISELKVNNPNIEVIGTYINTTTRILHKCLTCTYTWDARPATLLNGGGCPKCAGNIKRTTQEYIDQLFQLNKDIEVLDDYINTNTKILHRCKIHDYKWYVQPSVILSGCGCPKCGIEKQINSRTKTNEQYKQELLITNQNIIALENYINSLTPIKHKCLIDGNEWYARPANILHGQGCPKCRLSHGEANISKWLDQHKIEYNQQYRFNDCKDIKPLPFDFYIPSKNLCIEYDGEQHFKPNEYFGGDEAFCIRQNHDRIKNEYCKAHGISLLRIPYFKNIEEELNNFIYLI